MPDSFDQYSSNYNELVDHAIRQTGYETNNLVAAKLQKLKDLFPTLSKQPFHFLDFGCGVGNLFESLNIYFPQVHYTGVDPSKESILHAKSRFGDQIDFHNSDSHKWRTLRYDLIFSAGVFHHIPNTQHATLIQELSTLLQTNGRLVIWEQNPLNPITRKIVNDCEFDFDAVLVSPKTLKDHFENSSLKNVQTIYTTFFPQLFSSFSFLDAYLGWLPLGGQYLVTGQKI